MSQAVDKSIKQVSLFKLRDAARIQESATPEANPLAFVQVLVADHNRRQSHTPYQEVADLKAWGKKYSVVVYRRCVPSEPSSFASALEAELDGKEDAANRGSSVHFATFLWRVRKKDQKSELFALTTNMAWHLVYRHADHFFPIRIAQCIFNPSFSEIEARFLIGEEHSSKAIHKEGQEYRLGERELDSIWRVYKNYRTTFKEGCSYYGIQQIWGKKDISKEDPGVAVVVSGNRLLIQQALTMPAYQDALRLFSRIYRKPGKTNNLANEPETPDPSFDCLQNIQRIEDEERKKRLDARLLHLVYVSFREGRSIGNLTVGHPLYRDYFQSSEFVLQYRGRIQTYYHPPTYAELIDGIRYCLANEQIDDEKSFHQIVTRSLRLKFDRLKQATPLLSLLQGEVWDEEDDAGKELCFRLDGVWLRVAGDQPTIVQRTFSELIERTLLIEGRDGYLTRPWVAKENWAGFAVADLAKEAECSESDAQGVIAELQKIQFSFVGADDKVVVPYVTHALVKGLSHKRLVKKRLDEINLLLRAKHEAGEKLSEDDLVPIFTAQRRSKEETEGIAKKVLASLRQPRSICDDFQQPNGTQLEPILDERGQVITPHLDGFKWPKKHIVSTHKNDLIPLLISLHKDKKPLTAEVIAKKKKEKTKPFKNLGPKKTPELIETLKKGAKRRGGQYYLLQGPLPQSLKCSAKLRAALERYHGLYRVVCDEEGYSRQYPQDPQVGTSHLVFDQVMASGSQAIELFDLMHYTSTGEVFLYHIKEEFGQPTRDACSQIRVAANSLAAAFLRPNKGVLHSVFQRATQTVVKTPFRQLLKERLLQLGEPAFLKLFEDKTKITFVYAFVDTGSTERLLKDEPNPGHRFTHQDFRALELAEDALKFLWEDHYLDSNGCMTTTLLDLTKTDFKEAAKKKGLTEKQAGHLHYLLFRKASHFDSVIAKVELNELAKKMKELEFGFKICQIRRSQEASSMTPAQSEISDVDATPPLISDPGTEAVEELDEEELDKAWFALQEEIYEETGFEKTFTGIRNATGADCFISAALQMILHSPLLCLLSDESKWDEEVQGTQAFDDFRRTFVAFCKDYLNAKTSVTLPAAPFRKHLKESKEDFGDAWEVMDTIMGWCKHTNFHNVGWGGTRNEVVIHDWVTLLAPHEPLSGPVSLQKAVDRFTPAFGAAGLEDVSESDATPIQFVDKPRDHVFLVFPRSDKVQYDLRLDKATVQLYPQDQPFEVMAFIEYRRQGAHYICYFKEGAEWIRINDAVVDRVDDVSDAVKQGYLFYLKRQS